MTATSRGAALIVLLLTATTFLGSHRAETSSAYQKPPESIRKIFEIPPPPTAMLTPNRDYLLLAESRGYPSIAEVSRPFLRLAGQRINPRTSGPQMAERYASFILVPLAGGKEIRLKLPDGARPGSPIWSDDGKRFALANTTDTGIELWLGSTASDTLRKIPGVALNAALGEPIRWLADGKTLLCRTIPAGAVHLLSLRQRPRGLSFRKAPASWRRFALFKTSCATRTTKTFSITTVPRNCPSSMPRRVR